MSNEEVKRSSFERHGQSLVQIIIAGLCGWMALTTNETSKELAVLTERTEGLKLQIADLEYKMRDRYTSLDASRDTASVHMRLDNQSGRLQELDEAVKRLEQYHRQ